MIINKQDGQCNDGEDFMRLRGFGIQHNNKQKDLITRVTKRLNNEVTNPKDYKCGKGIRLNCWIGVD